jgi:uncharacterized delta-60 repeat protein
MSHRQPSRRTRPVAARDAASRFSSETLERRVLLATGGLDPSFSDDGQATVDFGPDMIAESNAAVVQPDGKTVVVGQALRLNGVTAVAAGFAVARLNVNGTLDTTFGPTRSGTAVTYFGEHAHAYAVALQADGKIVAVGVASDEFAVVRYNADGTLDRSFDGDGIKTFDFDFLGSSPVARTVLVQLDGRILIGGDAYTGLINGNIDFAFARLNPDGSFDSSFDGDGKRVVGFGGTESATAMALDYTGTPATNPRYGSIVAVGSGGGEEHSQLLVARLKPDGSLDSSFDGDGRVGLFYAAGHATTADGVVIQSDGRIVVAGDTTVVSGTPLNGLVLVRFLPNGAVDGSFGPNGNGWAFTDFGIYHESAADLIESADGGLLVGGSDRPTDSGGKSVIAAYTANGLADTRFGGTGRVVLAFGGGTDLAPGPGRRFAFAGGRQFHVARVFDVGANLVYAATLNATASETGPTARGFFVYREERLPYATRVYFDVGGTATAPYFRARNADYSVEGMVFPIAVLGGSDVPYADIPADQTFTVVTMTPKDDALAEGNETAMFTIRADPAYEVGNPRTVSLTIVDNDAPPPTVAQVYVRGTSWAGADNLSDNLSFQEALASAGLGDADLGYRLDSAPAGWTIPWINVDQVVLRYSSPPTGSGIPSASSVVLDGVRSDYAATSVAQLDARTYAVTLDRALGTTPANPPATGLVTAGDRIRLSVAGGGAGSGTYALNFNVLQGDVDHGGMVLANDYSEVKLRFFKSTNTPATGTNDYSPFHDVDASGIILAYDFSEVKRRFFNDLPPAAAAPAAAGLREPAITAGFFGTQPILV